MSNPFSNSQKAKENLETLRDLHINDRPEYAKVIPNLSVYETGLMKDGCPLSEVEALIQELAYYRGESSPPSVRLMALLVESLKEPDEKSEAFSAGGSTTAKKPRFPTSVSWLNEMTGGGYGLTTVAGDPKVGKTMFACGTALEAARDGWRVIFFNAELDRNEMMQAVMRYCGYGQPIDQTIKDHMTLVSVDYGFQPLDAIKRVREAVHLEDERVLIVLDSINALVDLSSDPVNGSAGIDFWAANSIWRNFAIRATRLTLGQIAFLVVSETNAQGGVKGRALEFKSDLIIRLLQDKEDRETIEIDVTSRSTRSGNLGQFMRDAVNGRYVRTE